MPWPAVLHTGPAVPSFSPMFFRLSRSSDME